MGFEQKVVGRLVWLIPDALIEVLASAVEV